MQFAGAVLQSTHPRPSFAPLMGTFGPPGAFGSVTDRRYEVRRGRTSQPIVRWSGPGPSRLPLRAAFGRP